MSAARRSTRLRSRQAFLRLLLGASTVFAAGTWLANRFGRGLAQHAYRGLVALPDDTPPGPLDADALAALTAAAHALLPAGVQISRYEAQFRWRAANRAGYRALYERFVAALDRAARSAGHARFGAADLAAQQAILARLTRARLAVRTRDPLGALRLALFDREWLVFDRHILRDLLALFAQTDAWLLAGYPSHPGTPRGLDTYRQPVPPAA